MVRQIKVFEKCFQCHLFLLLVSYVLNEYIKVTASFDKPYA